VILLHGCDGIQLFQERWTADIASWGYAALLIDSHGPRRIGNDCDSWPVEERPFDAFGGLRYLHGLPFVDLARVGVIGWNTGGGVVEAVLEVKGVQQFVPEHFTAGGGALPDRLAAWT
jgi:dienelactone hydrolase